MPTLLYIAISLYTATSYYFASGSVYNSLNVFGRTIPESLGISIDAVSALTIALGILARV